jgi:hypothetical protein
MCTTIPSLLISTLKEASRLDVVVHPWNSRYSGDGDWRIEVQGQLKPKKKTEILYQISNLGVVAHAYNPSYSSSRRRKITV